MHNYMNMHMVDEHEEYYDAILECLNMFDWMPCDAIALWYVCRSWVFIMLDEW